MTATLYPFEDDPQESAALAGLRYVEPGEAGYVRSRCGRGFTYRSWTGRTVRAPWLRRRFESLVIPPAWTEVWICRDPDGHLQATGRDAEGRKQYLYHPLFSAARARRKFDRLLPFGRLLPKLRARVAADLDREGLPREKVLAAVVRLLDSTGARIGNHAYARQNATFGLTTVRKRHVELACGGETVSLRYEAKGGKPWAVEVDDPRVAEVVAECLETPGYELFKYFDEDGCRHRVDSDEVNHYLGEIAGARVTAKDFRAWTATLAAFELAAFELAAFEPAPFEPTAGESATGEPDEGALAGASAEQRERTVVERAAQALGNTAAVCRESYVHPRVLEACGRGVPPRCRLSALEDEDPSSEAPVGLTAAERKLLALLGSSGSQAGAR
jgi:DNA topoisomerase-1